MALKRAIIGAGLVLVWISPAPALADVGIDIQKAAPTRCALVTAGVVRRTTAYQQRSEAAGAALQRVNQRLTNIIGRADARGYQVTALQADQIELQHRATQIQADFTGILDGLKHADATCGADGSLDAARSHLQAARTDMAAVQSWVRTNLAADLKELLNEKH